MEDELTQFAADLRQDVLNEAALEGSESTATAALTQRFILDLTDMGELDDGDVAHESGRGWKVNGYAVSEDQSRLDLFYTIMAPFPGSKAYRPDIDAGFKRLLGFLEKARKGLYKDLEESTPEWDMAYTIHGLSELRRIRLYVFTDEIATLTDRPDTELDGVPVSYNVWDLQRLYRALTSGQQQEPIEIDFVGEFGTAIPCLVAPDSTDYTAHFAIIPGTVLSAIYEQYGNRLLERNVRAFLQTRGKVNKGIQKTIADEPERFLAYNNGISATASEVTLVPLPDGGTGIAKVRDFQVVNGGQTTASIHYADVKAKVDISGIHVQTKLTVVRPEDLAEIVPLISRYANSQNKVNEADFLANDPFHVAIEKQSRTVWAPTPSGTQHQTKWFYERARGQYQDELAREGTPARMKRFKNIHPTPQKFSKTDLAKFENTWDQLPHVVSLGAEKSFRHFTMRLEQRGKFIVTQSYFEDTVAKAIMFRKAEKAISAMQYGGYRANIVTYTLAYLSYVTDQQIDLDRIWLEQDISEALYGAIQKVSGPVRDILLTPPASGNITEWCKKDACWEKVRASGIKVPVALAAELRAFKHERYQLADKVVGALKRSNDWMAKAELLEASGIPRNQWSQTIDVLLESGRIERTGNKRTAQYKIVEEAT